MIPTPEQDKDFPYRLVVAGLLAAWFLYPIISDDLYTQVLQTVSRGVWITISVTLVGFALASVIGLLLAVACLSRVVVLRQLARFYIEILRGVPILVLLLYVALIYLMMTVSLSLALRWLERHLRSRYPG